MIIEIHTIPLQLPSAVPSPSVLVAVGLALALVYQFYVSTRKGNIFDIYIDISNSDYELLNDNVTLFDKLTFSEMVIILLSLFHQYVVIDPQTGFQSLMANLTNIILFTVLVNFIVQEYLFDPEDD